MDQFTSPNKLRLKCYIIANHVYLIGSKYVKHKTIFTFFNHFFKPRLDNIILYEASEQDLRDVILSIKKEVDDMVKELDTIHAIKDNKLNDIKLEKLPAFNKLLSEYGL